MRPHSKRSIFSSLFAPHYDELSLFSMGYICLLFFFIHNPPTSWNFANISIQPDSGASLLIFVPLVIGMILCMYHAFTDREKTNLEKKFMIFFAAIINGFSGIWAGAYILEHSHGWMVGVFPIWNIISGYVLLSLLRSPGIEEETISDENITLKQLSVGTVFVTLIFYLCYFVISLNWAATFSICIAWSTSISNSINTLILRERIFPIEV